MRVLFRYRDTVEVRALTGYPRRASSTRPVSGKVARMSVSRLFVLHPYQHGELGLIVQHAPTYTGRRGQRGGERSSVFLAPHRG
jgi:hypothetical protein